MRRLSQSAESLSLDDERPANNESPGNNGELDARDRLLDSIAAAVIVTTPSGVITCWNRAAERLYGWRRAEVLGRWVVDTISPEDLAEEAACRVERVGSGQAWSGDVRVRRRDGSTFMAGMKAMPMLAAHGEVVGITGVSSEVTQQRADEATLRHAAAIIHWASDAIISTDFGGNILSWNRGAEGVFGCTAAEAIGQPLSKFTAPNEQVSSTELMAHMLAGESVSDIETTRLRQDGSAFPVSITVSPIFAADRSVVGMSVILRDLSSQRSLETGVARQALRDDLTGVGNRRSFAASVSAALSDRRWVGHSLAVLVVNLDRFHQVNEGLSQAAGDLILVEVARRLQAGIRHQDTVCRLGGDEFGVLMTGLGHRDDVAPLADTLRQRLVGLYWPGGNGVHVVCRVGIATAPQDGTDPDTLLRKAGVAVERARHASKGWAWHVQGDDEARRNELHLVGDLRHAIEAGHLTVAYQPIVGADGYVCSLEALARWEHPDRGEIPPDQFIPLAEQTGLIRGLTSHILDAVAGQAVQWASDGLPVPVAVNLSATLLGDASLADTIAAALLSAGLPAGSLTLEVTETALAEGGDTAIFAALGALRATGVRISLDDFGTGYSSLAYLKDLPVDEVKIDRSFTKNLTREPRTVYIVRSIIDLAHSLGLTVVAEGVEDDETASVLRQAGCDQLQGFGIARPATAETTTAWLRLQARPAALGEGDR